MKFQFASSTRSKPYIICACLQDINYRTLNNFRFEVLINLVIEPFSFHNPPPYVSLVKLNLKRSSRFLIPFSHENHRTVKLNYIDSMLFTIDSEKMTCFTIYYEKSDILKKNY